MERYVFIAVGGTGAKVAQSLVSLLAMGAPLGRDGDRLLGAKSAEDYLSIWRIDPDAKSGAADALTTVLDDYHALQKNLGIDPARPSDNRLWSLRVDPVENVNVIEKIAETGQNSLGRILNSNVDPGGERILSTLYTTLDREQDITQGFYQKPFIGSALLANAGEELKKYMRAVNPGQNDPKAVRFFICGSLFGGTGASGVPVLAKVVKDYFKDTVTVAGCALGPYFRPPQPPDLVVPEGPNGEKELQDLLDRGATQQEIDAFIQAVKAANPQFNLRDEQVRQILGGYYAKPEEILNRAANSLSFYQRFGSKIFDRLYFVGHPHPTNYDRHVGWSNGGPTQANPSHGLEYVAALTALDFFARQTPANSEMGSRQFTTPTAHSSLDNGIDLGDLPAYGDNASMIQPAEWILSVLLSCQFLKHHLALSGRPNAADLRGSGYAWLERRFAKNEDGYFEFRSKMNAFLDAQNRFVSRLAPGETGWERTLGWSDAWIAAARSLMMQKRLLPDGVGLFRREPEPIRVGDRTSVVLRLKKDLMDLGAKDRVGERRSLRDYLELLFGHLYQTAASRV